MARHQATVAGLLSHAAIKKLALPSNLRYGTAIYKRGGVQVIERGPKKIDAWVGGLEGSVAEGGGSRRRTQLFLTAKGLAWNCSGNPKDHQIFCKHCVALALAVVDRTAR